MGEKRVYIFRILLVYDLVGIYYIFLLKCVMWVVFIVIIDYK